jgi:hypothetical protein
MQNQQFSRLLRLARRTGDRLIVADEQGGDPVVILPIDEYEGLIEAALGPDFGAEEREIKDFGGLPMKNYRKAPGALETEASEPIVIGEPEEELESIEIPVIEDLVDYSRAEEVFMAPVVPERGIEEASDEADIDERAIEELWRKVEPSFAGVPVEGRKNQEMPQKPPQNPSMGEERFYLEDID